MLQMLFSKYQIPEMKQLQDNWKQFVICLLLRGIKAVYSRWSLWQYIWAPAANSVSQKFQCLGLPFGQLFGKNWATFWSNCLFTLRHRLRRIRKPSSLSKLLIVKKPVAFSSKFLFFRSFWPSETFSEFPSLRLTVRLINLGSFSTFTGPRLCCFVPLPSFVALFRAFCVNRKKKWLRTERRRETPTWPSTSRAELIEDCEQVPGVMVRPFWAWTYLILSWNELGLLGFGPN